MKRNLGVMILIIFAVVFSFLLVSCGKNEARGILKTEINESGELVITYSDGTVDNLGVVVGSDGKDGENGKDGADGEDGEDGVSMDISSAIKNAVAKAVRSSVRIAFNTVNNGHEAPSEGSGVIYKLDKEKGDALVITAYRVVYDSNNSKIRDDIRLFVYGAEYSDFEIEAEYVGGSFNYDIAVLKVTGSEVLKNSDVTAAEIRSSSEMVVGDRVVAVGNPSGDGISSTSGIISIDSENLRITGADKKTMIDARLMRTDAAVNKGNFGGGLFDSEGRLVGIVNYKIEEYGVDNIGFAIPSTIAMALADNIIYHCIENPEAIDSVPVRVLLGITVGTHEPKAVYDAKRGSVVIVEKLRIVEEVASTALAYGSIKKGDILLRASLNDGESVELTRQHYFIDMLLGAYVGDVVHITLLRDGQELTFDLKFTKSCTTPF